LSTPFRLRLPRPLLDEAIAQAQAELPNECCGLLAGKVETVADGPVGRVVRRLPLVNEAASPVEFLSEPRSMFAAVREMDRLGVDVLAVYHSHPTSDPIPSRKDRERNYSEDVMTVILSLATEPPQVKAWWLTADDFQEADWEVVDAEGGAGGT
jgi:proteasome lid subunit RPN8/RPN11